MAWYPSRRWRAPGGLFPWATYNPPAGILAALAGVYGRKNNPGIVSPGPVYFDIFNSSANTNSGKSNKAINMIMLSPLLPYKIIGYKAGDG